MTRPRDIADSINRINSSAADATAVTIDSSEQVGIGTATPNSYYSKELVVAHGTEGGITLVGAAGTATGYLMFADGTTGNEAYRGYVGYSHSTPDVMVFGTSGAERMRILSGGGITFNGDTATANALDDYEEGTWTPGITGMTFSTVGGVYTKIGRRVQCSGMIIDCTSGTASAVGAKLSGLPYTVSNTLGTTSLEDGGLFTYFSNLGVSTSTITVAPDDSSTEAFLYRVAAGGNTTVTTLLRTAVDASDFSCRFAFTYVST